MRRLTFATYVLAPLIVAFPALGLAATVTVMVIFDPTARGSIISPDGFAQFDIDRANASLSQTNVPDRFQLAYTHPIGFAHPSGEAAIKAWIRTDPQIQSLRNQYAADTVVLVTAASGFAPDDVCGSAANTDVPNYLFSESKFMAIVRFGCTASTSAVAVTFAHELGHLLGAQHEAGAPGGSSGRSYAHAWVNTSVQKQTLMASSDVACGAGCETVPQFSNPALNFPGTSVIAGNAATADNRRAVDEGMDVVQSLPQPRTTSTSTPAHLLCRIHALFRGTERMDRVVGARR